MRSLALAKTRLFELLSVMQSENLLDEKETSSVKHMTLFNDPVFIEVLERYDENEDEEELREDILNILKPAAESANVEAIGDAGQRGTIEEFEETSPLGKYLLNKKKMGQGQIGAHTLSSLLKPCCP